MEEYYPKLLEGYTMAGINIASENYKKAVDLLDTSGIDHNVLVANELLDGYVRLPVVDKKAIRKLLLIQKELISGNIVETSTHLTDTQIDTLNEIWDLYEGEELNNKAREKFGKRQTARLGGD